MKVIRISIMNGDGHNKHVCCTYLFTNLFDV